MRKRFRNLSFLMQVIVVIVLLFVVWGVLQFVLGLLQALIPVAIIALIVVSALWLFDKVND